MKKYWHIIFLVIVSILFILMWIFNYKMTTNIDQLLVLLTAFSAIVAAIFTIVTGFKQTAKGDVRLGSNGRVFKVKKLELVELNRDDSLVILPIDIINKGNNTVDKVHIDIKFSSEVKIELKAFTFQPTGGMIRESSPDLSCQGAYVNGWVNQTVWPKTSIDLGKQNWLYIYLENDDVITADWKVRTQDSERHGKIQLIVKSE